MYITVSMILALSSAAIAPTLPGPKVTIAAVCGGGTPEAFASGALARSSDGAVFRIEPGAERPGRKVSHNVTYVRRLLERLDAAHFQDIRLDKTGGAWCGITLTTDGSAHSVRWPTALEPNGALRHEFGGVPIDVWHVFLELQRAGTEQELCGPFQDHLVSAADLSDGIWLACQGPGVNPRAAGIYVLSDGDVLTWKGGPVEGQRCARIAGNEATALPRWHSLLTSVEFDRMSGHPDGSRYGNINCSISRHSRSGTRAPHIVALRGVPVGAFRKMSVDPRWATVEQVFTEIAKKFTASDAELLGLRRAMSATTPGTGP